MSRLEFGILEFQINPSPTTGLTSIGTLTDYELDAAPGTQIGTNYAGTGYGGPPNYTGNFVTFYGGGGFGGYAGTTYQGFFATQYALHYATDIYAEPRANTTVTEYTVYQDLGTETEASLDYPLKYITAQGVKPMTNTQFRQRVSRRERNRPWRTNLAARTGLQSPVT